MKKRQGARPMEKQKELTNAQSCLNRAHENELLFILLERDAAAPKAIREWCAERIALQKNTTHDDQIRDALNCAMEMERRQKSRWPRHRYTPKG